MQARLQVSDAPQLGSRKACEGRKVSGVIPVHNDGQVLRKTLGAIFGQTIPLDELVIVLDNCTDNSDDVIGEYRNHGFPIKVIRVNFRNVSLTHSTGFLAARNDILILYGAHWIVPVNYNEILLNEFERTGADLVSFFGGLCILTKNTLKKFGLLHPYGHCEEHEYLMRVAINGGNVVCLSPYEKYLKMLRLAYPSWRKRSSRRDLEYGIMVGELLRHYWPALRNKDVELASFYREWLFPIVDHGPRFFFLDIPYSLLAAVRRRVQLARNVGLLFGYCFQFPKVRVTTRCQVSPAVIRLIQSW